MIQFGFHVNYGTRDLSYEPCSEHSNSYAFVQDCGMDTLGGLLDAPRARGAFALRTVMTSPWSLRILAESPVTLIAGVSNELWVVPDDGEPVRIFPEQRC